MTLRKLCLGFVALAVIPVACSGSSSDGDDGNEAGNAGEGGTNATGGRATGGSTTGGTATGGRATGGRGGTAGSSGSATGGATEGGEGGVGAEGGSEGGADMGGAPAGGSAGAGAGGKAGSGGAGTGGGGASAAGSAGVAGSGGVAGSSGSGGSAGSGGILVEADCSDGMDNDSDGMSDCSDSDCALVCALGACPTGMSQVVYTATGLPVSIPDSAPANPAFASISVPEVGAVGRVAVQVSISHPFDNDLNLQLFTPEGWRLLSNRRGSSGHDYDRTIFVDTATALISSGSAPFAGSYRPERELAALNGTSSAGTWKLRVADHEASDTGQITGFSLAVCQCLSPSGSCEFGPISCENGIDDDGDGLVDCQEPDCASSPSCPATEHACGDAIDNDGDNLTDCADPSCGWACTALASACPGTNRIFTYQTRSVPRTIGPESSFVFPAPIHVASRGTIVASAVRFNAAHTYVGDLDLTLTSPSGTFRSVTANNGSDGDGYVNTVFVDTATTAVVDGVAPFTGAYRPQDTFGAWNAQQAVGLWTGELVDEAPEDGGTFTELSLGLCVAP